MDAVTRSLQWIDQQQPAMTRRLIDWANLNTGSHNLPGIARLTGAVADAATPLGGVIERIDLPPYESVDDRGQLIQQPVAPALSITKRPDAPDRILLAIHLDTVYAEDDPFQQVTRLDDDRLRGPGVCDAKGGLIVMLTALEAIERSGLADEHQLGWRILLNPDEELGSPASDALFRRVAPHYQLGLLYEPALEDGSIVAARKGSGNFTLIVRGRAAHAGRDFFAGANAIAAAASIITKLAALSDEAAGLTVNVGRIVGGGPVNIVPDLAVVRFNIRCTTPKQQAEAEAAIARIIEPYRDDAPKGITTELHGSFTAPPKPLTPTQQHLLDAVIDCGRALDLDITQRDTGGVCDGNRLAAAGLPNVDTLGVRGGLIHSPDEYVQLSSLAERARLSALLMMRLALGEIDWPQHATPTRSDASP